jgi:hypothetical protein
MIATTEMNEKMTAPFQPVETQAGSDVVDAQVVEKVPGKESTITPPQQSPSARPVSSGLRAAPGGNRVAGVSKPRYVETPEDVEQAQGARNLFSAVVMGMVGAVIYWIAEVIPGASAAGSVCGAAAALAVVALVRHAGVMNQRNGAWFAVTLAMLVAALLPLARRGLAEVDRLARARIEGRLIETAPGGGGAATGAVASRSVDQQPLPPTAGEPSGVPVTLPPPQASPPSEGPVSEFLPPPLDPSVRTVARLGEDVQVNLGGRLYMIRKDTLLPVTAFLEDEVTLKAGDHEVRLSKELVTYPSVGKRAEGAPLPETERAALEKRAQAQAVRRYPDLAKRGSEANEAFLEYYKFLKESGDQEILGDPEWPLRLAEKLAQDRGWRRADIPEAAEDAKAGDPSEGASLFEPVPPTSSDTPPRRMSGAAKVPQVAAPAVQRQPGVPAAAEDPTTPAGANP